MNRIRLLAMAATLIFALPTIAQQAAVSPATHAMPSVDDHVRMLAQKLDLTADQQAKVKPILQEMQDANQKSVEDQSLSEELRIQNRHAAFLRADQKIREFLTDDQKTKLDQLEHEQHPDVHGKGNGATPPTPQP